MRNVGQMAAEEVLIWHCRFWATALSIMSFLPAEKAGGALSGDHGWCPYIGVQNSRDSILTDCISETQDSLIQGATRIMFKLCLT